MQTLQAGSGACELARELSDFLPGDVARLIERLSGRIARLPSVFKLVLYGSYAKGDYTAESDIDIAVFFDCKKDALLLEEYRSLVRACNTNEMDVQAQAFSKEELLDPCGIIEEIVQYGIELPL